MCTEGIRDLHLYDKNEMKKKMFFKLEAEK